MAKASGFITHPQHHGHTYTLTQRRLSYNSVTEVTKGPLLTSEVGAENKLRNIFSMRTLVPSIEMPKVILGEEEGDGPPGLRNVQRSHRAEAASRGC